MEFLMLFIKISAVNTAPNKFLGVKNSSLCLIFEFDPLSSGLSSLINRDNPRFVGFGLKAGGASELQ